MPLFSIANQRLSVLEQANFPTEKALQHLIEGNLQKALGTTAKVDWSDARVICIAPNYQKLDLHAVQVIGANIELWT